MSAQEMKLPALPNAWAHAEAFDPDLFTGDQMRAYALTAIAQQELKWRTMDSAPLDGREVILKVERRAGIPGACLVGHYMPGGHCIEDHPPIARGWYFWNGCAFDMPSKPVAWMPLPGDEA